MDTLFYISYITLFVSSLYAILKIIGNLRQGLISGYIFLIPALLIFYVFPIITDSIYQIQFSKYFSVIEAIKDKNTAIVYNFYISLILLFFLRQSKKTPKSNDNTSMHYLQGQKSFINLYDKFKFIIWLLIISPLIYFIISGNYLYYSKYQAFMSSNELMMQPESHATLAKLCLLATILLSFVLVVIIKKNIEGHGKKQILITIIAVILMFLYFYFHGKRSIFAITLLTMTALTLSSGTISGRKLIRLVPIILLLFISFNIFYGKNISNDQVDTYFGLRTDFSRDYVVKMAIYNDLLIGRPILPYNFATFLFNVSFFIPRSMWPDKPQPYAVYFTNAAFGNFGNDHYYEWGLTTTIFAECISNIRWLGLLLSPLIIFLILRKESKSRNPLFKLLSIVISLLLILVQPIAFMVLILVYIIMLFKEKSNMA